MLFMNKLQLRKREKPDTEVWLFSFIYLLSKIYFHLLHNNLSYNDLVAVFDV